MDDKEKNGQSELEGLWFDDLSLDQKEKLRESLVAFAPSENFKLRAKLMAVPQSVGEKMPAPFFAKGILGAPWCFVPARRFLPVALVLMVALGWGYLGEKGAERRASQLDDQVTAWLSPLVENDYRLDDVFDRDLDRLGSLP